MKNKRKKEKIYFFPSRMNNIKASKGQILYLWPNVPVYKCMGDVTWWQQKQKLLQNIQPRNGDGGHLDFLLVSLFLFHLKHLGRFKSINTVSFVGFFWDSFGFRLGFCWCCLTFCWLTDEDTWLEESASEVFNLIADYGLSEEVSQLNPQKVFK